MFHMEPSELRHLRETRGETRAELADYLGCSAGAIVQWEGGTRSIPQWVADKLLSNVSLELPLDELAALVNHATKTGQKFEDLITQALREYLRRHQASVLPIAAVLNDEPTQYMAPPKPKRKASGE